jgi:hypothetical protein
MFFAFSPQSKDQKASSPETFHIKGGVAKREPFIGLQVENILGQRIIYVGKFKKKRHLNIRCLSGLIFF